MWRGNYESTLRLVTDEKMAFRSHSKLLILSPFVFHGVCSFEGRFRKLQLLQRFCMVDLIHGHKY